MTVSRSIRRLVKRVIASRFPILLMTYRYAKEHQGIFNHPEETPFGFNFMGNGPMQSGAFEPDETRIADRILPKVDVFINVGANIGYYCCLALQHGKKVIAFEPLESNLHYLYKNLEANKWGEDVEIFPLALSDRTGIVEIRGTGAFASLVTGWAGQVDSNSRMVPTSSLDTVLGSRMAGKRYFILVDIEGSEAQMLRGASSFLSIRPKPVWLMAIQISEHQPKNVTVNPNILRTFCTFWESGYDAWTADHNPRLVARSEIEAIADGGPDTIKVRNFLFIENHKDLDSF